MKIFLLFEREWSDDDHHYCGSLLGVFSTFKLACKCATSPVYAEDDEPSDRTSFCVVQEWRVCQPGDLPRVNPRLGIGLATYPTRSNRQSPDEIERAKAAEARNAVERQKQQDLAKLLTPEVKQRITLQAMQAAERQIARLRARRTNRPKEA